MSLIDFPVIYVNDPFKGRPLFAGKIFVGEPAGSGVVPVVTI